jgi:long-chain fatty acid transport protein
MRRTIIILLIICLSYVWADKIYASGFNLYEHGAKGTGMSGAFSARADDASAIFFNPAGLAYLDGWNTYVGGTFILPKIKFSGSAPYPGYGVEEETKDRTFYAPAVYLTKRVHPKIGVGIGVYAPFALGTEWDNAAEYTGRYISQRSELKGIYISPSAAYAYNEMISIGMNLNVVYSSVEMDRVYYTPFDENVLDVANVGISADNGIEFGVDVGTLIKPLRNLQFALVYRSEISNEYEGTATFDQILTGDSSLDAIIEQQLPKNKDGEYEIGAESEIPFPAQFVVGIMYKPMEKLSLEFDYVRFFWSAFDEMPIYFSKAKEEGDINTPDDEILPENYEDINQFRFGAEYQINRAFAVRLGYVYDETPVPDPTVSPFLPDNTRNDFSLGFGYTFGDYYIDASYMLVDFGERSTEGKNRNNYNGSYASVANLYSFGIGYKF